MSARQTSGRQVPREFKFHWGSFQRSPMMIDGEDALEGLRAALKQTPRLRQLLRRLVS